MARHSRDLRGGILGENPFVPGRGVPETIVTVADATLDVDMFRDIVVSDGERRVAFPPQELFEEPEVAARNWEKMFQNVRTDKETPTGETKVTVTRFGHNGDEFRDGTGDGADGMAIIRVTLRVPGASQAETKNFRIGKLRKPEEIIRALGKKGIELAPAMAAQAGLAAVRENPSRFFQALFGCTLGGGRYNVAADLAALHRAVDRHADKERATVVENPVRTSSPANHTAEKTPYARVSLLCRTPYKTILRVAPDARLQDAMDDEVRGILSEKSAAAMNVLVTGRGDEDARDIYAVARTNQAKIHALVSQPDVRSLRDVRTAAFNAEMGELGKLLEDVRQKASNGAAREAGILIEKLRGAETKIGRLRRHLHLARQAVENYGTDTAPGTTDEYWKTDATQTEIGLARDIERLEEKRKDHIKNALLLISEHVGGKTDLLVTNGPNGAIGLAYLYDFKVVFGSDVLENTPDEEKALVDRLEKLTGGLVSMRHKDTTGCGDSCMAAWIAAQQEYGQKTREAVYFAEAGMTDIAPGDYKLACALSEAFWRATMVKTMSGVMFRTDAPNFSDLPPAATVEILRFVEGKTREFVAGPLARIIQAGDAGVQDIASGTFGFHLFYDHKLGTTALPSSVDMLEARLAVPDDEIGQAFNAILMESLKEQWQIGINSIPERERKAKEDAIRPRWRYVAEKIRAARLMMGAGGHQTNRT